MLHTILVVAGPTACGKSALGISLAQQFNGEIINCDSVQMYRDFIIGSARISDSEMQGIPHHLLGTITPDEPFDVGKFIKRAQSIISDIVSRKKNPIIVGGTSLYISSLLYGLVDLPKADNILRASLEGEQTEDLYSQLIENDAESARLLHPNDRVRIIRALEACIISKGPIAEAKRSHRKGAHLYNAIIIAPLWPRSELYARIDARSEKMISDGLIEETQKLLGKYSRQAPPLKTIGYDEVCKFIDGSITRLELVPLIAMHTRRFAKRQMTWLRNEPIKRGWKIRPTPDDQCELLEGDTTGFARPKLIKHFSVLSTDFKSLVRELKDRLDQGVNGVEVWFVPGAKVI